MGEKEPHDREPRIVPRPPGLTPIGFFWPSKDLAEMTDEEINEFVGAVCNELRRSMRTPEGGGKE